VSGKRLYLCRSFRANALSNSRPLVAVLLERVSAASISLTQVSERFHLTTREQEVLQYLSEGGLTTKEIAMRMGISPNTVKSFLRLIMLKMGVSTRSGIVGKAMATKF
jgi:DNA-binding CsgD family transcriptional regulator